MMGSRLTMGHELECDFFWKRSLTKQFEGFQLISIQPDL